MKHPARSVIMRHPRASLLATALMAIWNPAGAAEGVTPFDMGTIVVTAQAPKKNGIAENQVASVVTQQEMREFDRNTVGDALNLLSGTTMSINQKNERKPYIRGFDSRQVGLFVDGIPVYVPYDGNIDLGRFTTSDLAAIQVVKGFSSVAYGPNTMGGAINLVTRKPVKPFEGDVLIGFAQGHERQAQANFGSNQGSWYVQGGVSRLESDGFRMSSDFVPTATEGGGLRNNDYRKDTKTSIKFGLTPNATDEYAIGYYKQDGKKGQPPSTVSPAKSAMYWKWPYWNTEGVYVITRTALGATENLKIKLHHDSYDNAINFYTDDTYTSPTKFGGSGPSIYNDKSDGGSVELESTRIRDNTLRLVIQTKKDKHYKNDTSGKTPGYEDMEDTLKSYALEDNYQLRTDLMLSVGVARQELTPDKYYKSDVAYLKAPNDAKTTDAQIGLFYDWTSTARLYATVARKSRLPTLADRYSMRMGSGLQNSDLRPEKAINYEIGYQGAPWHGAKAEAAIFVSDIDDKIQSVSISPISLCDIASGRAVGTTSSCSQNQNIGKVRYAGIELGLSSPLTKDVELGGNFTYNDLRNLTASIPITDVPKQKLIVHALYRPVDAVDLVAFVQHDGARWAGNNTSVQLAGYTALNLKAAYRPMKDLTVELGVNNATDKNDFLADGFPSPGRTWFANGSYKF